MLRTTSAETWEVVAGEESTLEFTVRRDGRVIDDLSDYLGAKGHLVALRDGDLAYLHVHPAGDEVVQLYVGLPEPKAAALLHSLARNHALVDGNKRLALGGTIAFLGMNGLHLSYQQS